MNKSPQELQKVTLNIVKGDIERIQKYYPSVPWSRVVRRVVYTWLNALDEKTNTHEADNLVVEIPEEFFDGED